MKACNGSVESIETLGLLDGPGIRTVVFLNGCTLRCKFCHNPEMFQKRNNNYTPEELTKKIIRNKPYFKNGGGVTFSGGEPLLQSDFIIECAKILKKENINIAIDTAGVGLGNYDELLKYIDLVLLDIKHTEKKGYKEITTREMGEVDKFIKALNKSNTKVWIRQVIVPTITDDTEDLYKLRDFINSIDSITRVDLLKYHDLGKYKWEALNVPYELEGIRLATDEDIDRVKKILES